MVNKKGKVAKILVYMNLWLPVIFWALIIFSFSGHPTYAVSEVHWQDFLFKKTIHLLEYGIFAALFYRGFIGSGVQKIKAIYYSFFFAFFYAVSDEFHQSFTPGRDPKIRDILIDSIGAFTSLYFLTKMLPKMNGKLLKIADYFGFVQKE